jgi:hypothetical protein
MRIKKTNKIKIIIINIKINIRKIMNSNMIKMKKELMIQMRVRKVYCLDLIKKSKEMKMMKMNNKDLEVVKNTVNFSTIE